MSIKNSQPHTDTSKLKESILSRIETESLRPKSRFLFMCAEYGMWLLWGITILAGALSFAEVMYISMHSGIEYYDLTHKSFVSFLVASLPLIWVIAFIILTVFAFLNMRLTKRGYSYSLIYVLGSSVVLTLVLGFILNSVGIGKKIDVFMQYMPMPYETVEEKQAYLWAHPEDGRITGMMIGYFGSSTDIVFLDVVDREWIVGTSELSDADLRLITSGEQVRLIGEADHMKMPFKFFVCSVHLWMHVTDMPIESIQVNREHIIQNIKYHKEKAESSEKEKRCMNILKRLMP